MKMTKVITRLTLFGLILPLLILMDVLITEANMTESREFMKGKTLRVAIIHVIKYKEF